MKKVIILLGLVIFSISLIGQTNPTLTIPTSLTQRADTNFWGSEIPLWFQNWTAASYLISTGTSNGTSTYTITDSWDPTNAELNTLKTNGANTSNWPLYWTTPTSGDSVVFVDTVTILMGNNVKEIKGKNTIENKTWGEYFKENHEIYWQTSPTRYIILAAKEDGTLLTLQEVIDIKNDYFPDISAFMTVVTKNGINSSLLKNRSTWPVD